MSFPISPTNGQITTVNGIKYIYSTTNNSWTIVPASLVVDVGAAFAQANAADTKATSAGIYANGAFIAANTPSHVANSAAIYANGAFTRANNSLNANTGGTITGNVSIVNANLAVSVVGADIFAVFPTANAIPSSVITGVVRIGGGMGVAGQIYANGFVDGQNNFKRVGYINIPDSGGGVAKTSNYVLTLGDIGEFVRVGPGGAITIPDDVFSAGDAIMIFNDTSGSITITCSITTAYIAGTDSDKATVSLTTRGIASLLFISPTVCVIMGNVS